MKIKDRFHAMNITNTSDVVRRFYIDSRRGIAILYYPADNARGGHCARAQAYSPFFKTDPDGPWYNYGHKTFVGNKDKSVPEAKGFAEHVFKIRCGWKPCPIDRSDSIPTEIYDRAMKALKDFEKRSV